MSSIGIESACGMHDPVAQHSAQGNVRRMASQECKTRPAVHGIRVHFIANKLRENLKEYSSVGAKEVSLV